MDPTPDLSQFKNMDLSVFKRHVRHLYKQNKVLQKSNQASDFAEDETLRIAAKQTLFLPDLVQDVESIMHHGLDTKQTSVSSGVDQVTDFIFKIISNSKHGAFPLFHDCPNNFVF